MMSASGIQTDLRKASRIVCTSALTSATRKWLRTGRFEASVSLGFFLIHAKPSRAVTLALSWFLFAAGIGLYFYVAGVRHRENPEERVTPTLAQMARGMYDAVLHPAEDDEPLAEGASSLETVRHSMLWKDTKATSLRF